jgi:hypothetical protein
MDGAADVSTRVQEDLSVLIHPGRQAKKGRVLVRAVAAWDGPR